MIMGLVDDFIALPLGIKLLAGFVLLLGGAIPIPIIEISLGDTIFFFLNIVLSFFEITVSYTWLIILYGAILLAYAVGWVLNFSGINFSFKR